MSTVTFNGYDLSKLIKVHWDIDPEILPAVDDRTTTVGDRNGLSRWTTPCSMRMRPSGKN